MRKYNFLLKSFIISCIITTLISCGYELRGINKTKPNIDSIYIDNQAIHLSDINERFLFNLTNNLRARNISIITTNTDKNNHKIEITSINYNKTVIATASSKLTTQYKLSFIVTFNFFNNNKPILSRQIVHTQRNYNYTQEQILGLENEEDIITSELLQEATDRIITQLTIATK
jgi:outer membrane lipopolysaccharide assembly protein LptE/RlpB